MNKNKIILIIIIVFLIITIIYKTYKSQISYNNLLDENIFTVTNNETSNSAISNTLLNNNNLKIKVHIIGEIHYPGLYELDEGSRINDLILIAGGNTKNADLNKINLAYQLSDGEKIYIPSIFDEITEYIYSDAGENVSEKSTNSSESSAINLNIATVTDLENISGIGPSLAQKIVDYRNSNGKFNSIDELKNVSGIGEKKFEQIKKYISVK